jgi:hypothetical protein
MKSIYLTLFAIILVLNGSLAAKLRVSEKTVESVVVTLDPNATLEPTVTVVTPPASTDAPTTTVDATATVAPQTEDSTVSQTFGFGSTPKKLEFFKMNQGKICFSDLGVNPEGIIIAVGLDNELYEYAFAEDVFVSMEVEYEISNMWRVDINYDGIIYVITRCGDTYYLDCERRWVKLPGCAIDIGAGRSGEIYKIGCEKPEECKASTFPVKPSSPFVFKLICICTCKCCCRRCKFFIKKYHYKTCEPAEKRFCYWINLPNDVKDTFGNTVKFTRIDAKFTGFPIVTDGLKRVYEFFGGDENKFKLIYTTPLNFSPINDIASDNDGNDFFSTKIASYIITGATSQTRIVDTRSLFKGASDISVGPYGMITFIGINDKKMYTVSKLGFN